jgi:hypothetical protein
MKFFRTLGVLAFVVPTIGSAADYPAPKESEWIARDFKFHTGEVMKEVKLHYTTIGDPTGLPVVALHGTGGSAANMLARSGFRGRTVWRGTTPRCDKVLREPNRDDAENYVGKRAFHASTGEDSVVLPRDYTTDFRHAVGILGSGVGWLGPRSWR